MGSITEIKNTLEEIKIEKEGNEVLQSQKISVKMSNRENNDNSKLTCRCSTPSGEVCNVMLTNNEDDTYTIDLNAYEPGTHTVDVEWDGKPIPGSPFLVRIMQAPDEQKVRAYGPGLFPGVLEYFQGLFLVDTKGGGPGALKVRIHGPKECFKVEMSRENPTDRIINVTYNPTIAGIYMADVLWCDQHIQGSPFEIFVAENEKELKEWNENRDAVRKRHLGDNRKN